MANGERASRLSNRSKEFWSRRPYFAEGKKGKRLTHRAERRSVRSRDLLALYKEERA